MTPPNQIETLLATLQQRLAAGEIDEATYERQRDLLVKDLNSLPTSLGTGEPVPKTMDLEPGSVLLDRWRIVRRLGQGGFGVVFQVEDAGSGESLAVKLLHPQLLSRSDFLARFRREFELMQTLVHERVVKVHEYLEDAGQQLALISMEFVAGCTVWDLLTLARQRRQPLPLRLSIRIAVQTLEALVIAHREGVLHRDVTPRNVLLAGGRAEELVADPGRDPQVKLVDFGLAGLVQASAFSQTSQVLGTTGYVAPETFDPSSEVTASADVYGVGAVTYELVTGQLPVGRFESPSELRQGLPGELAEVLDPLLLDLLRRRPDERPEASAALARFQEVERRVEAREQELQEAERRERACPETEERRNVDRHRWRVIRPRFAFALVLLMAGTAAGLQWQRQFLGWLGIETTPECFDVGTGELSEGERCVSSTKDVEFAWRYIPPGRFQMGSPVGEERRDNDEKLHWVTLKWGFLMGETEVTQGQWEVFMGKNPSRFKDCGLDCPVEQVNWYEALAFANELSKQSKLTECYELPGDSGKKLGEGLEYQDVKFKGLDCSGYRLPTEAEWEYAARAETESRFWTGENLTSDQANCHQGDTTVAVRSFAENPWGLYEVHGNVWEWTQDAADWQEGKVITETYVDGIKDPLSERGASRVSRGGGWGADARFCRAANRGNDPPVFRSVSVGFRLVRTLP